MEHIEIGLKDIFREPEYLALILNKLNKIELYQLMSTSFIMVLRQYANGKGIEFNRPDEFKQALRMVYKEVEKILLMSYNECGK